MDNQQYEILNDEVDLLSTLKRVLNAFQRRIKWLILFLILFVAGAMVLSFTTVLPIYKGAMIIKSRFLSPGEIYSIVSPLITSVNSNRHKLVSKELGITLSEAQSLHEISVKMQTDSVSVLFGVNSDTKDIYNEQIQQKIISFIQESKYAIKIKTLALEYKKARLATLEAEIVRLDSLKKRVEAGKLSGMMMAGGDLYRATLDFTNEKIQIQQYLNIKEDINIVSDFAYSEKANEFKHSTMLLAGFALGIIAWLLLVVFLELKEMLKKLK